MSTSHPDQLERLLNKLRSEYTGVGSRYYDVVTDAMMQTVAQHLLRADHLQVISSLSVPRARYPLCKGVEDDVGDESTGKKS